MLSCLSSLKTIVSFKKLNNIFLSFSESGKSELKKCFHSYYIILCIDMDSRLTTTRLVLAVVSTSLEEVAIWVIWRWLLPEFGVNLPVAVLITVMAVWAALGTWLFVFTTRALQKQAAVGLPSMVGAVGKVASQMAPEGLVRIRGELWGATSDEGSIEAGEDVVVVSEHGLKLFVRKIDVNRTTR